MREIRMKYKYDGNKNENALVSSNHLLKMNECSMSKVIEYSMSKVNFQCKFSNYS